MQTQKPNVSYRYYPQARAMCDALARALRVRCNVMDYVYETLLFPRAEAFASMDDARDALVRALRAYEAEAEACERALRAQGKVFFHFEGKVFFHFAFKRANFLVVVVVVPGRGGRRGAQSAAHAEERRAYAVERGRSCAHKNKVGVRHILLTISIAFFL